MESGGLISICQAVLTYWEGLKMTLKSILFWGGSQSLYYRLVNLFPISDRFYLQRLFLRKLGSTSFLCLSVPAGPGQTEVSTLDPSPKSSFFSLSSFYCFLLRDPGSWPRRGNSGVIQQITQELFADEDYFLQDRQWIALSYLHSLISSLMTFRCRVQGVDQDRGPSQGESCNQWP